jgi:hypothetical protein
MKKLFVIITLIGLISCNRESTPMTKKQLTVEHVEYFEDTTNYDSCVVVFLPESEILLKYKDQYYEGVLQTNSDILRLTLSDILILIGIVFTIGFFIGFFTLERIT